MTITAQRASKGKVAFNLTAGRHVMTTDVEAALGGDDLGPSPHDLFDASLASCTALTVKMYAARKAWPLDDVQVAVERDSSREAAGHYKLTRKIRLVGALDAEQSARLLEIANKCPIHKLMHGEIEVVTESV
jgi:putative redox protein